MKIHKKCNQLQNSHKREQKESYRSCGVATTLGIEAIFSVLVEQKGTQMAIYG
jgi:hypothetical protein